MKSVIILYGLATFVAALVAVLACYIFPVNLVLPNAVTGQQAPDNLKDILTGILTDAVSNPLQAIMEGSYLSILFWGCLIGLCLRAASETTKKSSLIYRIPFQMSSKLSFNLHHLALRDLFIIQLSRLASKA